MERANQHLLRPSLDIFVSRFNCNTKTWAITVTLPIEGQGSGLQISILADLRNPVWNGLMSPNETRTTSGAQNRNLKT